MKESPRIVAVLLSALVAASGCRPESPTSTRVEQWSQEQWPSKTPGAENSAVRQVVIPAAVSSADAPLAPLRLTTEATEVSPPSIIDPTRVEAGGFPERLLTEAEARRVQSQVETRQQLARLLVGEAWLQHRVAELEQAEWQLIERSAELSGCGVAWRERLANVRLHRGRAERELASTRRQRQLAEVELETKHEVTR